MKFSTQLMILTGLAVFCWITHNTEQAKGRIAQEIFKRIPAKYEYSSPQYKREQARKRYLKQKQQRAALKKKRYAEQIARTRRPAPPPQVPTRRAPAATQQKKQEEVAHWVQNPGKRNQAPSRSTASYKQVDKGTNKLPPRAPVQVRLKNNEIYYASEDKNFEHAKLFWLSHNGGQKIPLKDMLTYHILKHEVIHKLKSPISASPQPIPREFLDKVSTATHVLAKRPYEGLVFRLEENGQYWLFTKGALRSISSDFKFDKSKVIDLPGRHLEGVAKGGPLEIKKGPYPHPMKEAEVVTCRSCGDKYFLLENGKRRPFPDYFTVVTHFGKRPYSVSFYSQKQIEEVPEGESLSSMLKDGLVLKEESNNQHWVLWKSKRFTLRKNKVGKREVFVVPEKALAGIEVGERKKKRRRSKRSRRGSRSTRLPSSTPKK